MLIYQSLCHKWQTYLLARFMPSHFSFKKIRSWLSSEISDVAGIQDYGSHPGLRIKCQVPTASHLRIWGPKDAVYTLGSPKTASAWPLPGKLKGGRWGLLLKWNSSGRNQLGVLSTPPSFVAGITHTLQSVGKTPQAVQSTHSLSYGKDACLFKMSGSLTSMTLTTS